MEGILIVFPFFRVLFLHENSRVTPRIQGNFILRQVYIIVEYDADGAKEAF